MTPNRLATSISSTSFTVEPVSGGPQLKTLGRLPCFSQSLDSRSSLSLPDEWSTCLLEESILSKRYFALLLTEALRHCRSAGRLAVAAECTKVKRNDSNHGISRMCLPIPDACMILTFVAILAK